MHHAFARCGLSFLIRDHGGVHQIITNEALGKGKGETRLEDLEKILPGHAHRTLANAACSPQCLHHGMKAKANSKSKPVELGEYIVADPQICHGKPTFKGTRVMVFQVLEQVACGTPWERIVWSWRGKVPMAAIREAVKQAA